MCVLSVLCVLGVLGVLAALGVLGVLCVLCCMHVSICICTDHAARTRVEAFLRPSSSVKDDPVLGFKSSPLCHNPGSPQIRPQTP